MNPGGSVKDRAALAIVRDAEAAGLLKPGGTIVEGTARQHWHRTGAGRQCARISHGHRHPETQSQEKKTPCLQGAELIEIPPSPIPTPTIT